jgi:hypothetical protein
VLHIKCSQSYVLHSFATERKIRCVVFEKKLMRIFQTEANDVTAERTKISIWKISRKCEARQTYLATFIKFLINILAKDTYSIQREIMVSLHYFLFNLPFPLADWRNLFFIKRKNNDLKSKKRKTYCDDWITVNRSQTHFDPAVQQSRTRRCLH